MLYLAIPPDSLKKINQEEQDDGSVITTNQIDTPKGPLTAITGRSSLPGI